MTDFKKAKALYKVHIYLAEISSLRTYCTQTTKAYGQALKIASNQIFRSSTIPRDMLQIASSQVEVLKHLLDNIFQENNPAYDNELHKLIRNKFDNYYNRRHFDNGPTPTALEVGRIVKASNTNKAPSPDGVDNTIRVIYDKIPEPVCLFPAFGILIERIVLARLQFHLNRIQGIHIQQYGFKAGFSTEHALQHLLRIMISNRREDRHTAIVALDVQGVFDSLW
ncbi:uncharacterized protein LOC118184638 [Stegodyphus dumicola]|uniref:uncharacterized protein LOC118184638 n=1 Tax=Stegodyphus dumicola TaxID=202533 RepID=UPI0015B2CF34|nr:uncharacterized protein LOC118184638 [Stegodyphus dumicola]